jgi:hypothetical protein
LNEVKQDLQENVRRLLVRSRAMVICMQGRVHFQGPEGLAMHNALSQLNHDLTSALGEDFVESRPVGPSTGSNILIHGQQLDPAVLAEMRQRGIIEITPAGEG